MKFHNNTNLPIIVSSWIKEMNGISVYKDIIILPYEKIDIYSNVGEYIVSSQFYDIKNNNIWKNENLPIDTILAKFRNKCCVFGNFTCNFIENHFILDYEENIVTWSRKSI
jgi:hypothetical protein